MKSRTEEFTITYLLRPIHLRELCHNETGTG
jgi:hypothetical protein